MKFTSNSINGIRPTDQRQIIASDDTPGLRLIVQSSGTKTWAWHIMIPATLSPMRKLPKKLPPPPRSRMLATGSTDIWKHAAKDRPAMGKRSGP